MISTALAIRGGSPVFPEGPPAWPPTTAAIRQSISAALDDGSWGQYFGRWTEELSERLTDRFRKSNALLCCSGTIAVELALRAAGVAADDEVILAGYDFPGNFRAIEATGARPVLVDVVEGGWVIDPALIAGTVSAKTTAIIVSHLHGQIADIPAIRAALDSSGQKVTLIEDNCQAPGGSWSGNPLGSSGDISVLSFGGSKLLSAGRGGAMLTGNDDFAQRARIYSSRGNDAFPLSQLQAAALIPQLESLDGYTVQRHRAAVQLGEQLASETRLKPLQQVVPGESLSAYYKFPWLLNCGPGDWTRDEFIQAIEAEGLAIGAAFRGFTRRSNRRCRTATPLVNSLIAAERTILLHHPILLDNEQTIDNVVAAIEKVLGNNPRP